MYLYSQSFYCCVSLYPTFGMAARKKKKKDRTSTALNTATATNAVVTNNTGKGNHPMMRNQLLPKGLSNKSDSTTKGTTTDGSLPPDVSMTHATAHAQRHAKEYVS